MEVALAGMDLTLPQYRVLGILAEGSTAASGLADRLTVRRPSITALIDGLVAHDLVHRRQEDVDRRRVALRLTDDGVRTLAEADRAVDDYLISIAGHLPDKDEAMAHALHRAVGAGDGPRGAEAGGAVSKTEDRLDEGRAGGNGQVAPARWSTEVAAPATAPAYVPMGTTSRYTAPKATVDPDRSKSWIKRATPIVMAHKLEWFAR